MTQRRPTLSRASPSLTVCVLVPPAAAPIAPLLLTLTLPASACFRPVSLSDLAERVFVARPASLPILRQPLNESISISLTLCGFRAADFALPRPQLTLITPTGAFKLPSNTQSYQQRSLVTGRSSCSCGALTTQTQHSLRLSLVSLDVPADRRQRGHPLLCSNLPTLSAMYIDLVWRPILFQRNISDST